MTSLRQVYYSFPVRLLVLHWRNHLMLIGLWVYLALLMTGVVGRFFGMHYLMLTPEYRGKVDFWSFFVTGVAFGLFFMIWNLTTYLLGASRFPFLATLEAPFAKFSLNNAIIPLGFLTTFLVSTVTFQWFDELSDTFTIFINVVGFLSGTVTLILLLAGYFYLTNHDIVSLDKLGKLIPKAGGHVFAPGYRLPTIREIGMGATQWRVDTYLNERCRPRLVRSVAHYNQDILNKVFRQNHLNAVIVQVSLMLLLIILGLFMEREWARIPTGATIFILASMIMAMFGAITFWFRQWAMLVFFSVVLAVNWVSSFEWFNFNNSAYGIDYQSIKPADYAYAAFDTMASETNLKRDETAMRLILDNWLAKNRTPQQPKPKMVFLCVSGGGLRSALWTMQVMQQADKATQGKLLNRTVMIGGASGGMLGAAYLRELYLREQNGEHVQMHDTLALSEMGQDLLNPVCFGLVSNDLFIPMTTFQSGKFRYRKDRGYLFEHQVNENCRGFLKKPMSAYRQPEMEAKIPMMFITPYLVSDARRLVISPQGVSFMMRPPHAAGLEDHVEYDGVDFGKLFAGRDGDSLAFTSALRMNCTYPYILPNVWLPTNPAMEVIDAGFRDNYGMLAPLRFIHVFQDWIKGNTGGVVLVQVRCWEKFDPIFATNRKGFLGNMFAPAAAVNNLMHVQDFEQDNDLALLSDILGQNRLDVVRFLYKPVKKKYEASMNLHLSKREKMDLQEAFWTEENREALKKLENLLVNGK